MSHPQTGSDIAIKVKVQATSVFVRRVKVHTFHATATRNTAFWEGWRYTVRGGCKKTQNPPTAPEPNNWAVSWSAISSTNTFADNDRTFLLDDIPVSGNDGKPSSCLFCFSFGLRESLLRRLRVGNCRSCGGAADPESCCCWRTWSESVAPSACWPVSVCTTSGSECGNTNRCDVWWTGTSTHDVNEWFSVQMEIVWTPPPPSPPLTQSSFFHRDFFLSN